MQTCPQCGYTEIQKGKQISNVMNLYVQESKPSYEVGLNSGDEEVVFPANEATGAVERKFIRKDVYAAKNKPKVTAQANNANTTGAVQTVGLVQQVGTTAIPQANMQDKAIGTAIPTPPITPTPAPTVARDAFGNPINVVQP